MKTKPKTGAKFYDFAHPAGLRVTTRKPDTGASWGNITWQMIHDYLSPDGRSRDGRRYAKKPCK